MDIDNKQQIPTENLNRERDESIKSGVLRYVIESHNAPDNVATALKEIQAVYKQLGGYMSAPTPELFYKAINYFNINIGNTRQFLANSGVCTDTIDAVTQDYGNVILGQFTFRATPQQMAECLNKIKRDNAAQTDKYVLFFGVLLQYARSVQLIKKFENAFRSPGASIKTKNAFLDDKYSAIDALCLLSLHRRQFFNIADFYGISEIKINAWFDNLEKYAHLGQYAVYYALSALALGATDQQLEEIQAPDDWITAAQAKQYAKGYTLNARQKITKNNGTYRLHNPMLAILSRPVRSADSEKVKTSAPIALAIQRYAKDHNITAVSEYRINQVFECLNVMTKYGIRTNDGYIKIKTTLSEFADICFQRDASAPEKNEIKTALSVLDGLFIVVPQPRKVEAIRLVVIKKITTTDKGVTELEIDVSEQATSGGVQVVGAAEYKNMLKSCQSLSQSRFNAIIEIKNHQQEMTLLDDVFGYNDEIETARLNKETEAQIKALQKNIQAHLSRDKKSLETMFKKAQANNKIKSYTKKQTGIGKYNVPIYVYSWVSIKAKDQPDEQ